MGIPHQLVLLASCVDELQQSLVQFKIPHTDVLLILLIHRGFAGVVRDENLQERRLKSRASVRFSTLRSNRTRAELAFRCRPHLLAGALFFARVRLAKRHLEVEARHHGLDHVGIPAIPSVRLAEEDRECRDTPPGMDQVDKIPGCCESDPTLGNAWCSARADYLFSILHTTPVRWSSSIPMGQNQSRALFTVLMSSTGLHCPPMTEGEKTRA